MPSNARFPGVDAHAARRRFERAARTYAGAARLEEEIGSRMLERLQYLRLEPRRILDAASGTGREAGVLQARFREAALVRLDFSLGMLREGRGRRWGWKRDRSQEACADAARLPFAAASFDFVWCNMGLHWASDPLAWLREFSRVLAPEGLLMFSSLGPDTLKELRATAGPARVHHFVDMHDLGDMLVEAGLTAPVMDMEMLTFTYREGGALLADLRATGQTNARQDRPRGMTGGGFLQKLRTLKGAATFEVVYGHAWKGMPRKISDGRDIVQFRSAKGPAGRPLP